MITTPRCNVPSSSPLQHTEAILTVIQKELKQTASCAWHDVYTHLTHIWWNFKLLKTCVAMARKNLMALLARGKRYEDKDRSYKRDHVQHPVGGKQSPRGCGNPKGCWQYSGRLSPASGTSGSRYHGLGSICSSRETSRNMQCQCSSLPLGRLWEEGR